MEPGQITCVLPCAGGKTYEKQEIPYATTPHLPTNLSDCRLQLIENGRSSAAFFIRDPSFAITYPAYCTRKTGLLYRSLPGWWVLYNPADCHRQSLLTPQFAHLIRKNAWSSPRFPPWIMPSWRLPLCPGIYKWWSRLVSSQQSPFLCIAHNSTTCFLWRLYKTKNLFDKSKIILYDMPRQLNTPI